MVENGGGIGGELLWRSIRADATQAPPINQPMPVKRSGWAAGNLSNLAELSAQQESTELRARI